MPLFARKPRSRFPADMIRRLELFGRVEADPNHGLDRVRMRIDQEAYVDFWEDSQADPVGFLEDLRALTAGIPAGFATYGAARVVWELFGLDGMKIPAGLALVDAGIDFQLSRGIGPRMMRPYEARRWADRRDEGASR